MDENLIKAGTENFNLPHDVLSLPTGGLFYKNKKKSVKVGYLTANDENILLGALSGDKNNVVLSLLQNKLYEHDLRPEELLEGDVEAILIYLRNTSFGPEYKIALNDPKTDKSFTTTVVLDELNIKKTAVKPDENGLFITTLPRSGSVVKLRPLTWGEKLEIDKMADQFPLGRTAPKITWRLMKQIEEIDGETDKGKIAVIIPGLPIMDSKYIRNFLKENEPSLDLTRQIQAPSGELVTAEITFGVEFFRPFF